MNRREVILSGAAVAAGLAVQMPLVASPFKSRRLLVLVDPSIDASRYFGSLFEGDHVMHVELGGNRLLAWHHDVMPGLAPGGCVMVGLTHAADAQFFGDAAREIGMRQDMAWLHRRSSVEGPRHRDVTAAGGRGRSGAGLERAGGQWVELAAQHAAGGGAELMCKKGPMLSACKVHDLMSWRLV